MGVRNYRDLHAWQGAMELADDLYEVSQHWPKDQLFGLVNQARRAAVSIPSNNAEGQGRGSPADFRRFVDIANGSLCELETQLTLADRRGYIDLGTHERLLAKSAEVGRLLFGLRRSLESPPAIT